MRDLFDQDDEEQKRDEALDLLEQTRAELISAAKKAADRLAVRQGTVTSSDVFKWMRACGWGPDMDKVDPRWMGAVFRKGWERVSYVPSGSHKRPISVWRRA